MEAEHTCRICRGEATESQPLIHPCKCRGSIKYIHQECLMEWLNHSNKSTKQCDICNTPYRFRTIYDPNMPKNMPFNEIWRKFVQSMTGKIVKNISILLYVVSVVHVPLVWKFVSRVFTYALDGKLPLDFRISHVALYGAYTTQSRSGHLLSGTEATFYEKLEVFLVNTFLSGIIDVVLFVVVLFVAFIEHEWVVREEGYTKLLLRQIGKEPRTKLADLLTQMLQGDNEAARELMINRALEDLQNMPELQRHEAVLRRALDQGQHDDLVVGRHRINENRQNENDDDHENENENENNAYMDHVGENIEIDNHIHNYDHDVYNMDDVNNADTVDIVDNNHNMNVNNMDDVDDVDNIDTMDENIDNMDNDDDIDNFDNIDMDIPDETPEELERRRNLAEDEMAAAEAANNGDILELLGIRFNLVTPIQLMILADIIIIAFLFCVYWIPHFIGSMAAMVALAVCIGIHALARPLLNGIPLTLFKNASDTLQTRMPFVGMTVEIALHAMKPIMELLANLGALERVKRPTFTERVILLSTGYALICGAVYLIMAMLVGGKKPVMGAARRVYKVLFQILATAKVFTIFAIEIVVFPVYCGWLLDFCVAPLVVKDLVHTSESGTSYTMFFTTSNLQVPYMQWMMYWLWQPYVRPLLFWVAGTSYMFFIALFVGMVRNNILRPGVLYFIKSPEDPNARLIHDAIVKPFTLQTLRIFLSAKVYTAFIVAGIGSVTWGLRFAFNAPGKNGSMLPITFDTWVVVLDVLVVAFFFIRCKRMVAKYAISLWTHAFRAMCHKLRLSHFILGLPVPQERGYVLHRNPWHKFMGSEPDYARPVSRSEALQMFKDNASIYACFVPDGSFVRAPATDDNSRKFLRGMFVPVTKSDTPLRPEEQVGDEDTDWWDADIVYEDTYCVVYRPPNLRARCIVLVCMVCMFAAVVIVSCGVVACFVGPATSSTFYAVIKTIHKHFENYPGYQPFETLAQPFDYTYINAVSVCTGLLVELFTLAAVDRYMDPNHHPVEMWDAPEVGPGNALRALVKFPMFVIVRFLPAFVVLQLHAGILGRVESYFFGTPTLELTSETIHWHTSWQVLLHVALAPWTVMPLLRKPDLTSARGVLRACLDGMGSGVFMVLYGWFCIAREQAGDPVSDAEDAWLRVLVLVMVVFTKSAIQARELVVRLLEQIKNEKYATGSAIENID